ncbi:MAG: S41 family peptidase [Chitinophagaceae bacterium]
MIKFIFSFLVASFIFQSVSAQVDAGLFRFPDVSKTQIVFTYANDLWVVPKEGGAGIKLSSPPGVESFPKFSQDGSSIAYSGNYDGNQDVYVIPVGGGVPARLTQHGMPDRVVDWTPDGKRVLFASGRESGRERYNQFYTISAKGGPAEKLPLAYAEFGSYSPDGKELAVTFISQVFRNWKRYRGGWNADIHIFDLATYKSEKITTGDASDELPMWHNKSIYFLSDRGPELRMNLWRYDLADKKYTQLTNFKEYDAHFPSLGPEDIVMEAGGKLYLYQLSSQQLKEVKVSLVSDRALLKPAVLSAEKYVQHAALSPDGNRALIAARGEIFSVPAEFGYVKDLSRTSGAAERYPAWSPDGNSVAYWSDQSGEYELWLMDPSKESAARKLTSYGPGFRYNLSWSPDSKKLAFIDKAMKIQVYDITTAKTTQVDKGLRMSQGALENFRCNWSPDSRWITYSRDLENYHSGIFLYDYKAKKLHQATSGFYFCADPVFDADGKHLFLSTNQSFQPNYSDIDNTFIYANSTQLAAISLKKTTPSLLYAKNDEVGVKRGEEKQKADSIKKVLKDAGVIDSAKTVPGVWDIDLEGMETRMVILPIKPGNFGRLSAVKGRIIYQAYPNTGVADGKPTLKYYDIEKREEKTILDDVNGYVLSEDGKKILVRRLTNFAIIKPDENQKFEKPLRIAEMQMVVEPMQEWKQIFMDTWRMERDYFYDPNMHGVDWNLVKERYLKMLKGAMTREELNLVLGEMIGELNASHTYKGGGDEEQERRSAVGYLGIDFQAAGNYYKIKSIVRPAVWDAEVRSPLNISGTDIKEGDFILAVNGIPLTTTEEPFAAFQGLANKTVELAYNSSASFTGAKTAIVKTLGDESRLRHLAWIEANRKRVEEATNGDAGYIYVRSTGIDGQNELIRQFNAQWDKKALVIDERFNSGGQIPDRFIELLNRTPLAFWAIRDGETWPWPPFAHFGPKVMLVNGWSGSGGDAFPDYFQKKKLGPVIGTRTWGGLIGISGVPPLIDNGSITVPTFRMYNPDGTWFKEGHGVEPDIEVPEDLSAMAKGTDPQLERSIKEIKELLKNKPFKRPQVPAYEKRF